MSGGIEAAGDIATGALIGRAFEPRAGEGHAGGAAHGLCLNCGTALIGDYCHACGQTEHVHRTLSSIAHDLLHGVFHFEGKIWRTLPMLVLHPRGIDPALYCWRARAIRIPTRAVPVLRLPDVRDDPHLRWRA